MKHVSDNKHEFNLRRVDELSLELTKLENELEKTKGFFNRFKVSRQIKKLNREINAHAAEIVIYEQMKIEQNKSA